MNENNCIEMWKQMDHAQKVKRVYNQSRACDRSLWRGKSVGLHFCEYISRVATLSLTIDTC